MLLKVIFIVGAINVKSLVELAQKRQLQNSESKEELKLSNKSINSLDRKVEAVTKKHEWQEIENLYGANASDAVNADIRPIPDHLTYAQKDNTDPNFFDQQIQAISEIDKPVCSMGQAIENKDIFIDKSRIIDLDLGSGNINDFVPATTIRSSADWIPESEHYSYYQTEVDFPLNIEPDEELQFPEHLTLYTYEMGNCSRFPLPRKSITGL